MRVFIVDDEPWAREKIRAMLAEHSDFEIAGECGDGKTAVREILRHAPDLVFLDVQMPDLDGFGVIEAIGRDRIPAVVFVTAFDQHAIQAFKVHALDYLLKPFDSSRFNEALAHARRRIQSELRGEMDQRLVSVIREIQAEQKYTQRFIVRAAHRITVIKAEDIRWIEAAGNYAKVYAGATSKLIRETMNSLEEKLDPHKFARIHRSAIVNVEQIQELVPSFRGDHTVVLRDQTRLTLSRNYRDRLKHYLGSVS